MIASLAPGTIKQYETAFRKWWSFSRGSITEALCCGTEKVLTFLTSMFREGASYSTLNTTRSAISLLSGSELGSDSSIRRLLKGAFRLRPRRARYDRTWDPQQVLQHLSQLDLRLDLQNLSRKVAMLMALASGQRVQTLASINIENVHFSATRVVIIVTGNLKTSGPTRPQTTIDLPRLGTDLGICPVHNLELYLERTKSFRADTSMGPLFLCYRAPFSPASTQTLSRWLKLTLRQSGIDTKVFSSHSIRHASTSAAARAGVPIDSIFKSAGWTQGSSVFVSHYDRPLLPANNFVRAVFNVPP